MSQMPRSGSSKVKVMRTQEAQKNGRLEESTIRYQKKGAADSRTPFQLFKQSSGFRVAAFVELGVTAFGFRALVA